MKKNKKLFITPKARRLAKNLHNEEHRIIDGKDNEENKSYEWYYLMASGIFQNLFDKLDNDSIDIYNLVVELSGEIKELKQQMKEVAKQQKYLWQTLDEKEK